MPLEESARRPKVADSMAVAAKTSAAPSARRKELGAFYTPPAMATTLVEWAVRSSNDRVLDPSFGGLVFLRSAGSRLQQLGASADDVACQVYGMEIDAEAHGAMAIEGAGSLSPERLLRGDFLTTEPGEPIPRCQAVVGNPPYIRYQEFGQSSVVVRQIAERAGIRLSRLASSWVPFLIHAVAFVAPGGRLAQVLPAELLHAQYAGGVIDFLCKRFSRVAVAIFDERVFPGALEEVVLLFAEDRVDNSGTEIELLSCTAFDDLELGMLSERPRMKSADSSTKKVGRGKLLTQLLKAETQDLYHDIAVREAVVQLGGCADVDIGAVTGANEFFLLTEDEASNVAPALLRPAVSKAMQIRGSVYSPEDHERLLASGRKAQLFVAQPDTPRDVLATAKAWIRAGEKKGIPNRYKCRVRQPWWAVPLPRRGQPDLLLTYCASEYPRLVFNEAGVLQTNTIHGVYARAPYQAEALAAGFYNSLTLLSAELVGRSYGGGVLKLEPTEAERLLIPPIPPDMADLLPEVDRLIRERDLEAALRLVDPVVLGSGLDLTDAEIGELRDGAAQLRGRRRSRNGRQSPARRQ